MALSNFKPAITEVKTQCYDIQNGFIVDLEFELKGIHKTLDLPVPMDNHDFFYLYIFVVYYRSDSDFEIITSANHAIRRDSVDNEATFKTKFLLNEEHPYSDEDFVNNYYTLELHCRDRSAEDGSDINMMLGNLNTTLFSTKLIFERQDELNE